jgi:putative transposase
VPKKSFTEERILTILRAVEAGASAVDTCRKFGITETTFYRWNAGSASTNGWGLPRCGASDNSKR